MQIEDEDEPTISASNEKGKSKPLRKSKNTGNQPVLQTEEDRAEYMRHQEDVRILARELGGLQCSGGVENDAGANVADEQPRVVAHEGRLYLFQFPPVLPPLFNKYKKEHATTGDIEIMEVDAGPSGAAETIDAEKNDPREAVEVKEEPESSSSFNLAPELIPEEGFVGKLVVRKSGKVELDWGGIILNLSRGSEADYLQTTVVLEGVGEGNADARGTATGMGRLMGKFIATPDWDKLFEQE
jgi:DNA-directed RNA polymerase III subunit RPC4